MERAGWSFVLSSLGFKHRPACCLFTFFLSFHFSALTRVGPSVGVGVEAGVGVVERGG